MPPVDPAILLRARQRFADLDAVPIGLAVLDQNLAVLFWNCTLEQWTGLDRSETLGRPFQELNPEWSVRRYADRLVHLFGGGPPVVFSPLLHPRLIPVRTEGPSFHVKAASVPDGSGGWWAFLSVEDVTVLSRRIDELRALRVQQERLMREIHHRVKNNLNMISGLVTLQRTQGGDSVDRRPFDDLQSRIAAISEIHDILYHSTNVSAANPAEYLATLARLLDDNLSDPGTHTLRLDLETDLPLKTDTTVLLGLIQAELMTNALKYGLGGNPRDELSIRLVRTAPGTYEYAVTHSGDRLPAGFDPSTSQGLGMVLLTAYADQLGSVLEWERGVQTRFFLRFAE